MNTFNKLAGASTLKKDAVAGDDPLAEAFARVAANVSELLKPTRLEKGAMVERIHALGAKIRDDLDEIGQTIESELRALRKRNADYQREMFKARPFALDANDPRAVEFIGDAVRANPGLLDKLNKTH